MAGMKTDEFDYYQKALALEKNGNTKEALNMYDKLISKRVQNYAPYERFRIISKKNKDNLGVIYAMEKYIDMLVYVYHPDNGDKQERLGEAQGKLGDFILKNKIDYKSPALDLKIRPEVEQAIIETTINNEVHILLRKYPILKTWSLESVKFIVESSGGYYDMLVSCLSEGRGEQETVGWLYWSAGKTRRNAKGEIVLNFPHRNKYAHLLPPNIQIITEEDFNKALEKSKEFEEKCEAERIAKYSTSISAQKMPAQSKTETPNTNILKIVALVIGGVFLLIVGLMVALVIICLTFAKQ